MLSKNITIIYLEMSCDVSLFPTFILELDRCIAYFLPFRSVSALYIVNSYFTELLDEVFWSNYVTEHYGKECVTHARTSSKILCSDIIKYGALVQNFRENMVYKVISDKRDDVLLALIKINKITAPIVNSSYDLLRFTECLQSTLNLVNERQREVELIKIVYHHSIGKTIYVSAMTMFEEIFILGVKYVRFLILDWLNEKGCFFDPINNPLIPLPCLKYYLTDYKSTISKYLPENTLIEISML